MNSMATAGGLRDQISVLIEILRAKDKELQQYRNDGHKLWRGKFLVPIYSLVDFVWFWNVSCIPFSFFILEVF